MTYWGSKLTALRRAQKPSALGDEVTGAINLLVRLLPLVQMILMYRLYFPVSILDASLLLQRLSQGDCSAAKAEHLCQEMHTDTFQAIISLSRASHNPRLPV